MNNFCGFPLWEMKVIYDSYFWSLYNAPVLHMMFKLVEINIVKKPD